MGDMLLLGDFLVLAGWRKKLGIHGGYLVGHMCMIFKGYEVLRSDSFKTISLTGWRELL